MFTLGLQYKKTCQPNAVLVMKYILSKVITRTALPFGLLRKPVMLFIAILSFTAGFLSFMGLSRSFLSFHCIPLHSQSLPYSPEFGLYLLTLKTALYNHEFKCYALMLIPRHSVPLQSSLRKTHKVQRLHHLARLRTQSASCLSWFLSFALLVSAEAITQAALTRNKNTRQALRVSNMSVHRPPSSG